MIEREETRLERSMRLLAWTRTQLSFYQGICWSQSCLAPLHEEQVRWFGELVEYLEARVREERTIG